MSNRTLCEVLEEMRTIVKILNFSYMLGLIEEVQTLANRMEAALWDQKDLEHLRAEKKKLKEEIKELQKNTGKKDRSVW